MTTSERDGSAKPRRESFQLPPMAKSYKCDDCGCIFEARLLRGKQNKTSTPHLEAWMGPVNNCCHCGGTMVSEWQPLTEKEASTLNAMLRRRAK
jgi:hypothetical protein